VASRRASLHRWRDDTPVWLGASNPWVVPHTVGSAVPTACWPALGWHQEPGAETSRSEPKCSVSFAGIYEVSEASKEISTLPTSAFDTGQPSFAAAACPVKSSADMPGTVPTTVRCIFVSRKPASVFSNVDTAVVSRFSGALPEPARMFESAIE
jgi:hypothetical protein